jgi:hypothetical protein
MHKGIAWLDSSLKTQATMAITEDYSFLSNYSFLNTIEVRMNSGLIPEGVDHHDHPRGAVIVTLHHARG